MARFFVLAHITIAVCIVIMFTIASSIINFSYSVYLSNSPSYDCRVTNTTINMSDFNVYNCHDSKAKPIYSCNESKNRPVNECYNDQNQTCLIDRSCKRMLIIQYVLDGTVYKETIQTPTLSVPDTVPCSYARKNIPFHAARENQANESFNNALLFMKISALCLFVYLICIIPFMWNSSIINDQWFFSRKCTIVTFIMMLIITIMIVAIPSFAYIYEHKAHDKICASGVVTNQSYKIGFNCTNEPADDTLPLCETITDWHYDRCSKLYNCDKVYNCSKVVCYIEKIHYIYYYAIITDGRLKYTWNIQANDFIPNSLTCHVKNNKLRLGHQYVIDSGIYKSYGMLIYLLVVILVLGLICLCIAYF